MNEKYLTAGVTLLLGIIGVAVLATLVSKASDTTNVIQAGSGGFACILKTALTGVDSCNSLRGSAGGQITFPGLPGSGSIPF